MIVNMYKYMSLLYGLQLIPIQVFRSIKFSCMGVLLHRHPRMSFKLPMENLPLRAPKLGCGNDHDINVRSWI